jgi:hypothetical protein
VGADYTRAVGRWFRAGLDASYAFAGAAAVRYQTADGGVVQLGVQNHTIDGGVGAGVHLDTLGGLELRARLGLQVGLDLIAGSAHAPLPSDRVVGMTVGLGLGAPQLLTIANRPFGVTLFGLALAPASRAQTEGLEEGTSSSTYGATFGGGLHYGLYKGLGLDAVYGYQVALTHFSGAAHRNVTITAADRASAQHLITFGLAYSY